MKKLSLAAAAALALAAAAPATADTVSADPFVSTQGVFGPLGPGGIALGTGLIIVVVGASNDT